MKRFKIQQVCFVFMMLILSVFLITGCGSNGETGHWLPARQLTSIQVTPATYPVPVTGEKQFTATAVYSDGASIDVTKTATWHSVTPVNASVGSHTGIATGNKAGTSTTITADYGGKSGSATLTVNAATTAKFEVTPIVAVSIPVTGTQQYAAIETFSDGTTFDRTRDSNWSSPDLSGGPSVATIDNTVGSLTRGKATGVNPGTSTITATYGVYTGAAAGRRILTVTAAPTPAPTPASCAGPGPVDMGAAASFGVLVGPAGGATLTNNGLLTMVNGDVGAASQTTAPAQSAGYTNYTGTAAPYVAAKAAMLTAIGCASTRACTVSYPGATDFGGMTLAPGVHCVTGNMSVGSNLTISTPGVYIFKSTGNLMPTPTITMTLGGTANASNTSIFWVPTGWASIGANNVFLGTIMPDASAAITLGANTTLINGRVLSNSDVTLSTNTITIPTY